MRAAAVNGRASATRPLSSRWSRSGGMDCGATAVEKPRDLDADRCRLDFRKLAALDEYRQRDVGLGIRREEHEPCVGREVQPASTPLRRAGLAAAISGYARGTKPVVHVVWAVDLLAHALAHSLDVGRRCRNRADHVSR